MNSSPSVSGIIGVIIWTTNVELLVDFYSRAFDIKPHRINENFVAFKFGSTRLNIGFHEQVEGRAKDPYRIMINLGTDNIHELAVSMVTKGVKFIRMPELEAWGGFVATFKDPENNIVQVLQAPTHS